ncbi:hypothetical protein HHO41_08740 [Bacillus sp. DNRA2]|uniref:hypothetical protein n=1 Tax=Bacillus sp. DNRA2 TaxID=2723053 RepID=UPI00145FA8F1|nr:hypothetical protein [Bacillus sp. DNRA2]NMD70379.1 hypothetical protein [Bacillus sp. DNRA2]
MVQVKTVVIDGEPIHFFNSAIYIFESSNSYSIELTMVVSEIVVAKYNQIENLFLEIELTDGRLFNFLMHQQGDSGGLPKLNLFCEVGNIEEYYDFQIIHESDPNFPDIEAGLTIEEIRKHEMPNVKVNLKLTLPIDQAEWLSKQKKKDLEHLIRETIYEYWDKQQD